MALTRDNETLRRQYMELEAAAESYAQLAISSMEMGDLHSRGELTQEHRQFVLDELPGFLRNAHALMRQAEALANGGKPIPGLGEDSTTEGMYRNAARSLAAYYETWISALQRVVDGHEDLLDPRQVTHLFLEQAGNERRFGDQSLRLDKLERPQT